MSSIPLRSPTPSMPGRGCSVVLGVLLFVSCTGRGGVRGTLASDGAWIHQAVPVLDFTANNVATLHDYVGWSRGIDALVYCIYIDLAPLARKALPGASLQEIETKFTPTLEYQDQDGVVIVTRRMPESPEITKVLEEARSYIARASIRVGLRTITPLNRFVVHTGAAYLFILLPNEELDVTWSHPDLTQTIRVPRITEPLVVRYKDKYVPDIAGIIVTRPGISTLAFRRFTLVDSPTFSLRRPLAH